MTPIRCSFFAGLVLFLSGFAHGAPLGFRLDLAKATDLPAGLTWVNEGRTASRACASPSRRRRLPPAPAHDPVDIEALRGREILLSYDVRTEGVTKPEKDYNGIKSQLHFVSAAEGPRWFNEGLLYGTIPWRHSRIARARG